MKLFKIFAFTAFAALTFTACSDDDTETVYVNTSIPTTKSDGLEGKVKSMTYTLFYSDWDYENEEITKRDPYYKRTNYYTEKGLLNGYDSYYQPDMDQPEFALYEESRFEYDNKYRITYLNEKKRGYGPDDLPLNALDVESEYRIVYNDNDKKAIVTYTSKYKGEVNWSSTRSHPLKADGTIDEEVFEEYKREEVSPQRAIQQKKQSGNTPLLDYKTERIILSSDQQKNWTASYIKSSYFGEEGEVTDSYGSDYQERTITYY